MYGVILMVALTTGGEATDSGHVVIRHGCYGCYGGGYGGGYGGCYGGCYGGWRGHGCHAPAPAQGR